LDEERENNLVTFSFVMDIGSSKAIQNGLRKKRTRKPNKKFSGPEWST
jgi:hypothetical protein